MEELDMSFNLYLVRHGETYLNKYDRMQGWSDAPLTDKGIQDGRAAGKRLANIKFNHVYSSDLTRAVETAKYIMHENNDHDAIQVPVTLPEFREEFFGSFEGLHGVDLAAQIQTQEDLHDIKAYGDLMAQLSQDELMDAIAKADSYHDAENAEQFWARLERGLKFLREHVQDGENVLVVAHGTLIRNLSGKYAGREYTLSSMYNGSVSKWTMDAKSMELEVFNDIEKVW